MCFGLFLFFLIKLEIRERNKTWGVSGGFEECLFGCCSSVSADLTTDRFTQRKRREHIFKSIQFNFIYLAWVTAGRRGSLVNQCRTESEQTSGRKLFMCNSARSLFGFPHCIIDRESCFFFFHNLANSFLSRSTVLPDDGSGMNMSTVWNGSEELTFLSVNISGGIDAVCFIKVVPHRPFYLISSSRSDLVSSGDLVCLKW